MFSEKVCYTLSKHDKYNVAENNRTINNGPINELTSFISAALFIKFESDVAMSIAVSSAVQSSLPRDWKRRPTSLSGANKLLEPSFSSFSPSVDAA